MEFFIAHGAVRKLKICFVKALFQQQQIIIARIAVYEFMSKSVMAVAGLPETKRKNSLAYVPARASASFAGFAAIGMKKVAARNAISRTIQKIAVMIAQRKKIARILQRPVIILALGVLWKKIASTIIRIYGMDAKRLSDFKRSQIVNIDKIKTGWWKVSFDLTLEGEIIRFEDLSDISQEYILKKISEGYWQGEIVESIDEEDDSDSCEGCANDCDETVCEMCAENKE